MRVWALSGVAGDDFGGGASTPAALRRRRQVPGPREVHVKSEAPPLEPVPDGSPGAPKPKKSPVREGFGAENGTEIANLTAPGAVRSRI